MLPALREGMLELGKFFMMISDQYIVGIGNDSNAICAELTCLAFIDILKETHEIPGSRSLLAFNRRPFRRYVRALM